MRTSVQLRQPIQTNVRVSKPRKCKCQGSRIWPTSGTRREDQELGNQSVNSGRAVRRTTSSYPTPRFLIDRARLELRPFLDQLLDGQSRLASCIVSYYAMLISPIPCAGVFQNLVEALRAIEPCVKTRPDFVTFNRYIDSSTGNEGFAGM